MPRVQKKRPNRKPKRTECKTAKLPNSKLQLVWIGEHFEDLQRCGDGYKALYPAHVDSNPSLSISKGDDGRILVHCFAGCPPQDILDYVGLQMADLMPGAKRLVATYDYRDESGKLLYQCVRYEPKDFRQRNPEPGGDWV